MSSEPGCCALVNVFRMPVGASSRCEIGRADTGRTNVGRGVPEEGARERAVERPASEERVGRRGEETKRGGGEAGTKRERERRERGREEERTSLRVERVGERGEGGNLSEQKNRDIASQQRVDSLAQENKKIRIQLLVLGPHASQHHGSEMGENAIANLGEKEVSSDKHASRLESAKRGAKEERGHGVELEVEDAHALGSAKDVEEREHLGGVRVANDEHRGGRGRGGAQETLARGVEDAAVREEGAGLLGGTRVHADGGRGGIAVNTEVKAPRRR